jgi:hypothetical protein
VSKRTDEQRAWSVVMALAIGMPQTVGSNMYERICDLSLTVNDTDAALARACIFEQEM